MVVPGVGALHAVPMAQHSTARVGIAQYGDTAITWAEHNSGVGTLAAPSCPCVCIAAGAVTVQPSFTCCRAAHQTGVSCLVLSYLSLCMSYPSAVLSRHKRWSNLLRLLSFWSIPPDGPEMLRRMIKEDVPLEVLEQLLRSKPKNCLLQFNEG